MVAFIGPIAEERTHEHTQVWLIPMQSPSIESEACLRVRDEVQGRQPPPWVDYDSSSTIDDEYLSEELKDRVHSQKLFVGKETFSPLRSRRYNLRNWSADDLGM